jgi:hypothetical protein
MSRFRIVLFAIVFSGLGCTSHEASTTAENGFRFSDPQLQKTFAGALEKARIQFRQIEDGTVVYGATDEEKVKRIRNSVLESSFKPSYRFEDEKLQQKFAEQLKSQGVGFGIETRGGKSWITWSPEEDVKVKGIREEILDKSVGPR